jgi:hypothetical protein
VQPLLQTTPEIFLCRGKIFLLEGKLSLQRGNQWENKQRWQKERTGKERECEGRKEKTACKPLLQTTPDIFLCRGKIFLLEGKLSLQRENFWGNKQRFRCRGEIKVEISCKNFISYVEDLQVLDSHSFYVNSLEQ